MRDNSVLLLLLLSLFYPLPAFFLSLLAFITLSSFYLSLPLAFSSSFFFFILLVKLRKLTHFHDFSKTFWY